MSLPQQSTPPSDVLDFETWYRAKYRNEVGRLFTRGELHEAFLVGTVARSETEPAIDPDFGVLRDDLEALSARVYERLHSEIVKRGINLPGCDTTDRVLEVLDRWSAEALRTQSATELLCRREWVELKTCACRDDQCMRVPADSCIEPSHNRTPDGKA